MDPEYTFTVQSYVYNVILIPCVDIPGQLYTRHAVDADSDTEQLGVDPLSARIMQPVVDDHPAWIRGFWSSGMSAGHTQDPVGNGWGLAGITVMYTPPAEIQCGFYRYWRVANADATGWTPMVDNLKWHP